jgi:hypothetical protein
VAPLTAATEYCLVRLGQTVLLPLIIPGAEEDVPLLITNEAGELLPQLFTAFTVNDEPEIKLLVKFTSMLLVPCPLEIVAPVGAVQL